ncbi:MAG: glycosyltransferase family 2 protein [Oscillatoriales cyanobacterium RM1_1_9]|nr:glycosyltransferase family 2 protein [Oscillatoriales cyanobacterium SM2_3_0]NJO47214.1 glycosyltransferase family 2 protein [Oscillatoriales cyanobacterium RM2_1_1]NJO70785.1 glycosyltransferase family 2 protein [Oscillatoriales cyanobacterium RM1_1_9]
MRFSVVITTYNRLELLQRALHSALQQTIPSEVVVVDDCSQDGTEVYLRQLVQRFQAQGDLRLIYHRNPGNRGHSAAVNVGVEMATGEWIKPLDDDDYLAPNCLEQIRQAIAAYQIQIAPEQNSEVVICSCQAAQVDPQGQELSRTRIFGPGQVFYTPQADIHFGMLLEQLPFGTPVQVAYRKAAFLKSGGWDSSLDANCDDIDSWIRIAQFGDALFLNQCLAYRTIWPGSYNQTFSYQQRLATNILMKEKILAFVHPKYSERLSRFSRIESYLRLHWGIVALRKAKLQSAWEVAAPALFSPRAWGIFFQVTQARRSPQFRQMPIQKAVLIE